MDAQKGDRLTELMVKLQGDITDDETVELLSIMLDEPAMRVEARELCYRWLNEDSSNTRVRLMLAKSFYLDGYAEFCTRELAGVRRHADSPSVSKLIELIGKSAPAYAAEESPVQEAPADEGEGDSVFAEVDFDEEFVEALEDLSDAENENKE